MTGMSHPHSMYIHNGVQFRDPFSKDLSQTQQPSHQELNCNRQTTSWDFQNRFSDINRALTPPPDMSAPTSAYRPVHLHHDTALSHPTWKSTHFDPTHHASPHSPPTTHSSATMIAKPQPDTQQPKRQMSPAQSKEKRRGSQSWSSASQQSTIASQYQIPKAINDSGGSVPELAAQITCLFWFESSTLLQQIEDGTISTSQARPLVLDAKPSTGFRKWVTTMISTTLVGTNVVLLALLFIRRLKRLNPSVKGKPGSEFRLLTVALMLGNKFLDDNTYTNKTWAEVSGINVAEVHIMEVEFLSNMKYCLYTSAKEWSEWMGLLGKYADFIERASRSQPAPTLPSASSLNLPMALPSPPASNFASPSDLAGHPVKPSPLPSKASVSGLTPAPSPATTMPNWQTSQSQANARKRSHDDQQLGEPAAKRVAASQPNFSSPLHQAMMANRMQQVPRLPLPSLHIPPPGQSASGNHTPLTLSQSQQLPPLHVPNRSMGLVYPPPPQAQLPHTHGDVLPLPTSQIQSQQHSRQQSPYPTSAGPSPTNSAPRSNVLPLPAAQISPSYHLQQRNSPYRPIHNVSTLLFPPPSATLQQRPQAVELNRMHYQPLGRPAQLQTGRLPHVPYNMWPQSMTPTNLWQGFASNGSQASHTPSSHHKH